jgi:hypothetical protein
MVKIAGSDEEASGGESSSSGDSSSDSDDDSGSESGAPFFTYTTKEEQDSFQCTLSGDQQTLQYQRALTSVFDRFVDKSKPLQKQKVSMEQ